MPLNSPVRSRRLPGGALAFCLLHCSSAYRRCRLEMELEECPLRQILQEGGVFDQSCTRYGNTTDQVPPINRSDP